MNRAVVLLPILFAACAEAPAPPAAGPANVTTLAPPFPGPPPAPPLSAAPAPAPACPGDLATATGKACSLEGQACGDPAKAGFGLVCRGGAWKYEELPHPPCCKK